MQTSICSTWEAKAGLYLEFQASLVYRGSTRTTRATQRNEHCLGGRGKEIVSMQEKSEGEDDLHVF